MSPIYVYRCEMCGLEFDHIKVKSEEKPHCPRCNSSGSLTPLIGKTTFQLKGETWHRDGYANKKK